MGTDDRIKQGVRDLSRDAFPPPRWQTATWARIAAEDARQERRDRYALEVLYVIAILAIGVLVGALLMGSP